jgi:hypothetical protein
VHTKGNEEGLGALILGAIVPRAFPFALATTTDTDGVVEFGKSAAVDGDSKIAEFGGNATWPDNLAELGYELAELGSSGLYEWWYDNFASDCYTLISGNRWKTAHVRNGEPCYRTCGSLGRVLGGYGRFCKDARAEREYTNLPPHQKVKVEFKVVLLTEKSSRIKNLNSNTIQPRIGLVMLIKTKAEGVTYAAEARIMRMTETGYTLTVANSRIPAIRLSY